MNNNSLTPLEWVAARLEDSDKQILWALARLQNASTTRAVLDELGFPEELGSTDELERVLKQLAGTSLIKRTAGKWKLANLGTQYIDRELKKILAADLEPVVKELATGDPHAK